MVSKRRLICHLVGQNLNWPLLSAASSADPLYKLLVAEVPDQVVVSIMWGSGVN